MGAPFKLRGYAIERLLGSGSSGEVWLARAGSARVPVAVKRIPVATSEQRGRAEAEAALLCALEHPNLVRLHAVVQQPDAVVLVLDLADGGSLAELLSARGRLAPGEVVTALAPVAAALAYLHGEGVVHGDVSPGNVLFTAGGVPLLADVGVARLVGVDRGVEATPAYVDPAVAAGSIPGPPSDVFMLGAVALHALTGTPPWLADDPTAALALAADGALDDVGARLVAAGVPAAMHDLLIRALTVDPYRRGTAAELALELRHSVPAVAVELAAGRARAVPVIRPGPRHAARPVAQDPGSPTAERGRPPFERPRELGAGREPPTHQVHPRPRPLVPRPAPRRRRTRALAAVGALATAGLVAGGAVWAWADGRDAPAPPPSADRRAQLETNTASAATRDAVPGPAAPVRDAASTARPVANAATEPSRAGTGAPPAGPPTGPLTAPPTGQPTGPPGGRWERALDALDAVRGRAFATRDLALLRRVYVPGPLLQADTALLRRLVPNGCGLTGVRTTYSHVFARSTGGRATVQATARLPPTQLVCGGRPRATVPGAGPTRLRLELTTTPNGIRIARQALEPGGSGQFGS